MGGGVSVVRWSTSRLSADRLALALALLVGGYLRLHTISEQILVDDEWHMVHALRGGAPLLSVLGDFGANDHSIGLSLCAWTLMRLVRADETVLRLPSLLAGFVLLGLPLWFAPRLGRSVAIVWTWLIAVSPLLCFFTRLARPYAMTVLLTSAGLLAFHAWAETGRRRDAWTYYLASALAPVFHLAALPALLAPVALSVSERVWPWSCAIDVRRRQRLIAASLATTALLLALPAVLGGRHVVEKLRADHFELATIPGLLQLSLGTARWPLVVAMLGLIGAGLRAWVRTSPTFASYLVVAVVVQSAAIVASGATAVHVPIVAARYFAVVLPVLLLLAASGLVALLRRLDGGARVPAGAVGIAAGALLLVGGPLPWIYETVNDFTNHASYQADYRPGRYFKRFRPVRISSFYVSELASAPPGSMTIVEAPWYFYFHSLAYYQRVHRQRVLLGFVTATSDSPRVGEVSATDPGIALGNAVDLANLDQLRARHVRYAVFHRNPMSETRWPTGVTDEPIDMSRWIESYARWCGPPVFEDAQLVVFSVSDPTVRDGDAH